MLRRAVRADGHVAVPEVGPVIGLVEAARAHRVQGYVARALEGSDHADPGQLAVLRRDQAMAAALHARALDSLGGISELFAARGISWLAMKGPVLTGVLYDGPGMRSYGDLDLLVGPRDLGGALRALEDAGGVPSLSSWRHALEQLAGELPVLLPNGLVVDLHWDLVNSSALRRDLRVASERLFDRSRTVVIGAAEVRTMDAVDTLLHLCLHAVISGGNRLIWLKDIQLAAAAVGDAWDEVAARAEAWGVGLMAAVMLTRAQQVLGLVLPDDLHDIMTAGRAWMPLPRVSALLSPVERSVGTASLDRMVVRSTGRTARASYATLVRKIGRGTIERLSGRAGAAHGRGGPDDERWRAAFVEAVARS